MACLSFLCCREDTAWVYDPKSSSLLIFGGWASRWLGDLVKLNVAAIIGPPYACTSERGLSKQCSGVQDHQAWHCAAGCRKPGPALGHVALQARCLPGWVLMSDVHARLLVLLHCPQPNPTQLWRLLVVQVYALKLVLCMVGLI